MCWCFQCGSKRCLNSSPASRFFQSIFASCSAITLACILCRYSVPATNLWSAGDGPIFSPRGLLVTRRKTVVSSSVTMSSPHPVSGVAVNFSCVFCYDPVLNLSFACFNFLCFFVQERLQYEFLLHW